MNGAVPLLPNLPSWRIQGQLFFGFVLAFSVPLGAVQCMHAHTHIYFLASPLFMFAYTYTKEYAGIYMCVCVCVCVRARAHCTAPKGTENARTKPKKSCPCIRHDGKLGSRGTAPFIINLGTRCNWVVSFTLRVLYSPGYRQKYLLNRAVGRRWGHRANVAALEREQSVARVENRTKKMSSKSH